MVLLPLVPARASANGNESTMAREIADDINRERAARHLPALAYDTSAAAGAQRVAESNRDRPCHACHSGAQPSGEIVWWGSDYPSSGSPIWWMGSPPHRALVLAPGATAIGVGVACNGTEHDAVAWIQTTDEAQNASPTPVVTKAGTGSRCTGAPTTRPTTGGAAPTVAPTTSRSPVSVGGDAPATTSSTRRGATTTTVAGHRADAPSSRTSDSSEVASGVAGEARTTSTTEPPPFVALAHPVAASSNAPVTKGVGPTGTILLLLTFGGALALGLLSRKNLSKVAN